MKRTITETNWTILDARIAQVCALDSEGLTNLHKRTFGFVAVGDTADAEMRRALIRHALTMAID